MKKLIILFVLFSPLIVYSLPPLVITEVAPGETSSKDWIEIFVSSSGNYGDYKICCGYPEKVIKILPSRSYKKGDIIVITMSSTLEDNQEKQNYWMFYSTDTIGLYSTEGTVYITDKNDNWIDAVGWSNRDGKMAEKARTAYNKMKQNNMWIDGPQIADGNNDIEVGDSLVDWSKGTGGASIQRYRNFNGLPKDTNSINDWFYSKTNTKGYGYKEIISETQKVVEVDKNTNPFSPEDLENNFVKINFNIEDPEAKKTMIICDISGKEVIKLLDKDQLPNGDVSTYSFIKSGSITWDGKRHDGSRVPTGVYIVYFEAYNSSTGKKYVGKDVVVVGRKW